MKILNESQLLPIGGENVINVTYLAVLHCVSIFKVSLLLLLISHDPVMETCNLGLPHFSQENVFESAAVESVPAGPAVFSEPPGVELVLKRHHTLTGQICAEENGN